MSIRELLTSQNCVSHIYKVTVEPIYVGKSLEQGKHGPFHSVLVSKTSYPFPQPAQVSVVPGV